MSGIFITSTSNYFSNFCKKSIREAFTVKNLNKTQSKLVFTSYNKLQ